MVNTIETIAARRSIRRFKSAPVPADALERILKAASQAPSGHNRQPWRFTVVQGDRHAQMVDIFRSAVSARKAEGKNIGSAAATVEVMAQAPVTVFVHNPEGIHPWVARSENWQELVDVQATGAAIENMLLAAHDMGIGSLWIADVWEAYDELSAWLKEKGLMVAAVSFGYPDENPSARPRKPLDQILRYL